MRRASHDVVVIVENNPVVNCPVEMLKTFEHIFSDVLSDFICDEIMDFVQSCAGDKVSRIRYKKMRWIVQVGFIFNGHVKTPF